MVEHQVIATHFWELVTYIFLSKKQEMWAPLIGFSIDIGKGGEVVRDNRDGGDAELVP